MNEPTNHVERDHDSGGGRISQDRRILTNIGLAGKDSFDAVLAVAKSLDRATPDCRRAAIFKTVAQLDDLKRVIEDSSGLLRDIAARGLFPLEPPREGGRVRRTLSWLRFWVRS